MFSRRAATEEIAAGMAALYPSLPGEAAAAVLGVVGRPRRGSEHVDPWVHEQVRRAAARSVASATGLDSAAFPPDGEDGLRVYLPRELEDAPVDAVPAPEWERARAEAWGDHGEVLEDDRELWWAEQAAAEVEALLEAWRSPGAGPASG